MSRRKIDSVERLSDMGLRVGVETGSDFGAQAHYASLEVVQGDAAVSTLLRVESSSSAEEATEILWKQVEDLGVAFTALSQERRGVRRKNAVTLLLNQIHALRLCHDHQLEAQEAWDQEREHMISDIADLDREVNRLSTEPLRLQALLQEAGETLIPLERFATLILESDYSAVRGSNLKKLFTEIKHQADNALAGVEPTHGRFLTFEADL